MTPANRRYIMTEATIGAVISAALSLIFVFLLFGGLDRVPVGGVGGLLFDALPQGFAIAFMATLMPSLIARARLRKGKAPALEPQSHRWPTRLIPRALVTAVIGAIVTAALTALLLLAGMESAPLTTVIVAKVIWGALLGWVVAAAMTRIALGER